MSCTSPSFIAKNAIWVACGQCDSCRIDRAREWSIRLSREAYYHSCAVFLTLTYHDDFLPSTGSFRKEDFQLFMKRLRKALPGRKLKYYASTEYGPLHGRQHWHAILYGIDRCKVYGCRVCSDHANVMPPANSDCIRLEQAWSINGTRIGIVDTSGVGVESCQYVANYIQKVGSFPADWDEPFSLMSKGLGRQYALENQEHLYESLTIRNGSSDVAVPRYFRKVLASGFGAVLEPVAKWYMATVVERNVSEKEARRQWEILKRDGIDNWTLGGYAQYLLAERKQRQFVIDALRRRRNGSESVRDTRYVS